MTKKLLLSSTVLGAAWLMSLSAFAAINRPADHEQGFTYEECAVDCSEFADTKGCREFRRANLICTEKKATSWPIYTAGQLAQLEC